MAKRIKFGKITIVIFITALIWIWADLALDEEYTITGAQIKVSKPSSSNLWVNLDGKLTVAVESILVEGPASRISELRQKVSQRNFSLTFFLIPEEKGITTPGPHPVDVSEVIRRSDQIKRMGLTVVSCKPQTIVVDVGRLVKKSLNVKIIDDSGSPVKPKEIAPSKVEVSVPEDWFGDALVKINSVEIKQASSQPVQKIPYVKMTGGETFSASVPVKVTMPVNTLKSITVNNVILGITFGLNLQGKYRADVLNESEVMSPIVVRATPQAVSAYENMRYQVKLEIEDSDKDVPADEPLIRQLTYNFPPEYIERGEISLNQQPVTAQFKLIPVPASETAGEAGQ